MEDKEEYEMRLARQMKANRGRQKKGMECVSQCMETSPFTGRGVLVIHKAWDKETHNKTKRQPTEWKKIFANDVMDFVVFQLLSHVQLFATP